MSQIAPNPNPSGYTITVTGTPAENLASFENNGAIIIDSTLNNTGTLNNNAGGSIAIVGTLDNYGSLNSAGNFVLKDKKGTVNNYNTFTFINTNTNTGNFLFNLNNYNNFTNSGTLCAYFTQNTGQLINNAGATLSVESFRNSGTLNNSGTIITDAESFSNNTGTLNNSGTVNSGPGGAFENSGALNNSGSWHSGTLNNTGNVTISSGVSSNPENSPGTIAINGDFASAGTLVFEIAPGLSTGLCGVLNINGNANFTGGNIRFDFINGFTAAAGNHWDFFHANTITGWNTLHVAVNGLGAGLGWKITRLQNGKKRLSII